MTNHELRSDGMDIARELAGRGIMVATATIIDGARAGRRIVVTAEDVSGTSGDRELDVAITTIARDQLGDEDSGVREFELAAERVQVYIEVTPPRPKLIILGAVHIAQALVELSEPFGFERIVIDARAPLANRERFPSADHLIVAWPDEGLAQVDVRPRDAIAVLTHDPKFDEPALVSAVATNAGYIGAVGSRKTSEDRRVRLEANGLTAEDISRIHGPIGLDIGGKTPPEMALSILAEIIATRNGRTGQSLISSSGRIRSGEA